MFKFLFDTRYVLGESDEYKAKWCMLRAVEWGFWPLFVAQPIAPLALLYMPTKWEWLVIPLVALSWLWVVVRYRFVSLPLAQFGMVLVRGKWFTGIGAGVYLVYHHSYEAAALAALWPLVTLVLIDLTPTAKIGVLQQMFASRILALHPQAPALRPIGRKMWPFSKKPKLPGFKRTAIGDLTFDITEEEKQEIDKFFDMLKDHRVHPDFADSMTQGLTARGLANYAEAQISSAQFASQKNNREEHINKAIASIGKAYSIYQLPIYLYDLACCLNMKANGHEQAANTFKLFLQRQSEYKPGSLDDVFMRDRDIDEAKKNAVEKLRETTK